MISTALSQILITVWIGTHPITYTLPKLYPATDNPCQEAVNRMFARRKPDVRMTIECVPTDKRTL